MNVALRDFMKIIDNSPIDKPAAGRLVTLNKAIGGMVDCCLYILPDNEGLASEVASVVTYYRGAKSSGDYLNEYDFEVLEDMAVFEGQRQLLAAIRDENANLVMPLKTPHSSSKQYIVAHVDRDKVFSQVGLMIYTSERITKQSYSEVLRQYAADDTDGFFERLDAIFTNEGLWTRVAQGVAGMLSSIAFGGVSGIVPTGSEFSLPRDVSFRKKNEMLERMKDNIKKYRKNRDPKAEAELTYLLNNLDKESLLAILSALPKQQLEAFYKTANPRILAEKSKMKLDVRYVGELDSKYRTNGNYRLFLKKDLDQIQVHFKYKESFVVYLIYLIDKLQKDEVDSLSIKDYQPHFLSLYEASYDEGGEVVLARFKELFRSEDKDGNLRQAQLKHCYSDIRSSLSTACSKIDELPAPFILQNYHDHLFVLKENINVDQTLINLFNGICK